MCHKKICGKLPQAVLMKEQLDHSGKKRGATEKETVAKIDGGNRTVSS
jgi:hypothetical protein